MLEIFFEALWEWEWASVVWGGGSAGVVAMEDTMVVWFGSVRLDLN